MATNYERGRQLEYDAKAALDANGYLTVRSAGSKGAVDIMAIKPGQVLLVQCKRQHKALSAEEWNVLYGLATAYRAIAILAEREPHHPITWWQLTGPKKRGQRSGLPREPFIIDPEGP